MYLSWNALCASDRHRFWKRMVANQVHSFLHSCRVPTHAAPWLYMRNVRLILPCAMRLSTGTQCFQKRRLRQAQGLAPGQRCPRRPLPRVTEPVCPPLTPRRATWLVLRRATKRTEAETQQLTQLQAQHAEVAEAIDLAQDFATLVRQRQPGQLDPWLQRATSSTLDALRRFAKGLSDDYQAVKASVTLPWSTGPVEGHINRLNMLKRQMFGRAHLDLLGHRFLRAPREREAQVVGPRAPGQGQAAARRELCSEHPALGRPTGMQALAVGAVARE